MDNNKGRPTAAQGAEPSVWTRGDWRMHLTTCSRQRIVQKILEMLKRRLPVSGKKGLEELKKEAVQFEEGIYTAAMSQSEYLRKISLKMLTLEPKNQNTIRNSLPPNPPGNNNSPSDSGEHNEIVTSQGAEPFEETVGDWRTQLPTDSRQRIVNKIVETLKIHRSFSGKKGLEELKKEAVQFEERIYTAAMSQSDYLRKISLKMLTLESKNQNTIRHSLTPNPPGNNNSLSDSGEHNGIVTSQGAEPFEETVGDWRTQLPTESRQRIVNKIVETLKIHPSFSGQEGLEELKKIAVHREEKIYTAATSKSDYLRRMSLKILSMEYKSQNRIPISLPPSPSSNNNMPLDSAATLDSTDQAEHSKKGDRQEEVHQKVESLENQIDPQIQSMNMHGSLPNMQLNNMEGMQHTSLSSLSGVLTSQQIMNSLQQASSLYSSQGNASALEQGNFTNNFSWQNGVNMLQPNIPLQSNPNMLQHQHLRQQQEEMLKHLQMLQFALVQQMWQHQQQLSAQMQAHQMPQVYPMNDINELKIRQGMGGMSGVFQQHISGASLDSTAQTGNTNEGDWQEEVHQKIKAMKEMYFPELNEMHKNITLKLQQYDSLPQPPKSEQLEKLKMFKTMLERILAFLQVSKINIIPSLKEKLGSYEKQIINFINSNKMRKPIPPHQQGQLGQPLMQQPQSQTSQILAMKEEMYLPDLNEMDQNIAWELEQHDSLAQPPNSEPL